MCVYAEEKRAREAWLRRGGKGCEMKFSSHPFCVSGGDSPCGRRYRGIAVTEEEEVNYSGWKEDRKRFAVRISLLHVSSCNSRLPARPFNGSSSLVSSKSRCTKLGVSWSIYRETGRNEVVRSVSMLLRTWRGLGNWTRLVTDSHVWSSAAGTVCNSLIVDFARSFNNKNFENLCRKKWRVILKQLKPNDSKWSWNFISLIVSILLLVCNREKFNTWAMKRIFRYEHL